MFLPTITRMSEFVMLYPSQFGCAKSSILTRLNPMYIDSSCPNLDIGIKIPSMCINSTVIDPKEWCCVARCTFLLRHIIANPGDKLKKPTKKSFHVFSFDDTEEKVAVRFEGEGSQGGEGSHGSTNAVTLCHYLDPDNKLPIDPSIRFLCVSRILCDVSLDFLCLTFYSDIFTTYLFVCVYCPSFISQPTFYSGMFTTYLCMCRLSRLLA